MVPRQVCSVIILQLTEGYASYEASNCQQGGVDQVVNLPEGGETLPLSPTEVAEALKDVADYENGGEPVVEMKLFLSLLLIFYPLVERVEQSETDRDKEEKLYEVVGHNTQYRSVDSHSEVIEEGVFRLSPLYFGHIWRFYHQISAGFKTFIIDRAEVFRAF